MKLLLETDVEVNAEDHRGCTALQLAVFRGHTEVERLLMKNDASEPADIYGLELLFLGDRYYQELG